MEQFFTLIFIKNDSNILLGKKKRGFAKGTWNGYGGKIESNETKFQCAVRELKEESNLTVKETDLKYLGDVSFANHPNKRIVHIFTTTKVQGELKESEEMAPKWFQFNEIPYSKMLPDSIDWIPLVLKDKFFNADFIFDEHKNIIKKYIEIVDNSTQK